MGLADAKNDIKTLFLIVNSLSGLIPGFVACAMGVTLAVTESMEQDWLWPIIPLVVGLIVLAATALGYCGAIKENKVMLLIYSGIMTLAAVGDVVQFLKFMTTVVPLVHFGLALLALGLAVTLAISASRAANSANQGCVLSPPPTSYDDLNI